MSVDDRSPLQNAVAAAIAASEHTRDYHDSQIRKRLETTGKPLWDIERGKSKRPSPRVLREIEDELGLEHESLVDMVHPSGRAPIKPVTAPVLALPEHQHSRSADAGETAAVNRMDLSLPMGPGALVDDYVEEEPFQFDIGYLRSFTRTPPARLRLARGIGDSMTPTILPNDDVLIDTTQNQLLHSDRIYAASINGGAAIKRLRPIEGGRRILVISDNKTIEPYAVDAIEVVIWGRVIRCARDL